MVHLVCSSLSLKAGDQQSLYQERIAKSEPEGECIGLEQGRGLPGLSLSRALRTRNEKNPVEEEGNRR
jgi:hypothetical protein